MAKKADLEAAEQTVADLMAAAERAECAGDFTGAIARAREALGPLRDAVAYRRKFAGEERPGLEPVDVVLRLAPALFDSDAVDAVDSWQAAGKRAERQLYADLPDRIADARRRMALAARLWSEWDAAEPPPADADGRAIGGKWEQMGQVRDTREGFVRTHGIGRPVTGKCPECGVKEVSPLMDLLARRPCAGCQRDVWLIVSRVV